MWDFFLSIHEPGHVTRVAVSVFVVILTLLTPWALASAMLHSRSSGSHRSLKTPPPPPTDATRSLEALVAFLRRLQQLEQYRDRYILRELLLDLLTGR